MMSIAAKRTIILFYVSVFIIILSGCKSEGKYDLPLFIKSFNENYGEEKIKEENIDDKEEKKKLKTEIKDTEETVEAMKIAMRSMKKYNTAFATGESVKKSKYPVITLCGSTRFKKEFIEAQKRLTLEGNIVLSVGLFGHSGDEEVWEDMDEGTITKTKIMLDDMHKRKIDMSDEIYVINVGGYIGDSTKSEIEYAKKNGKRVRYLETNED